MALYLEKYIHFSMNYNLVTVRSPWYTCYRCDKPLPIDVEYCV